LGYTGKWLEKRNTFTLNGCLEWTTEKQSSRWVKVSPNSKWEFSREWCKKNNSLADLWSLLFSISLLISLSHSLSISHRIRIRVGMRGWEAYTEWAHQFRTNALIKLSLNFYSVYNLGFLYICSFRHIMKYSPLSCQIHVFRILYFKYKKSFKPIIIIFKYIYKNIQQKDSTFVSLNKIIELIF
jgi:hypothetical protein